MTGELLRDGWSRPGWKNEGLLDQTVGLIGFGAVARWTARLLSAFGVKLFINADHVSPEEAASYGARKATIDEIMSGCKIVSVHLARTPQTYHIIDERRLKLLREGAIFINTARGSIVDEAALARELATGRFRAALDVYEAEPLPMDSPLRTLPQRAAHAAYGRADDGSPSVRHACADRGAAQSAGGGNVLSDDYARYDAPHDAIEEDKVHERFGKHGQGAV